MKTVSIVNDVWRRSDQWGRVTAGWPVLELVPSKRTGATECLPGFGRVVVGVGGFALQSDDERVQVVLDGVRVGIAGRWGGVQPADEAGGAQVAAAVWEWVSVNGLQVHWVSSSLHNPSGEGSLLAEYVKDAEGARVRAVGHCGTRRCASPWYPTEVDPHHMALLAPGDDARWVDSRTVEISTNPLTGKRLRFRLDYYGNQAEPGKAAEPMAQEVGDLPPADPAFAAHFRDAIYDDPGAEFGPFGSDEGFELVHQWTGAVNHASLRQVLTEVGMSGSDRWLTPVQVEDCGDPSALVDDAVLVQSAGFAVLRLTGRIDAEGKSMVLHALEFLIGFYGGPREYVVQRDDLSRWIPK